MANGFIFGGQTGTSYEQLQRQRAIAQALAQQQAQRGAPRNVGEGLSALGSAIAYRRALSDLGRQEAAGRKSAQEAFAPIQQFLTGQGGQTPASFTDGGPEAYREAISSIESSGNYSAIGPETGKGRAYGRYQVMDFNIGPWTEEVLGQRLTPQEFLNNPQAQDAVFDAKFGQAVRMYGNPQDAASVWFTGRPAAEGAGRSDVLGTTGAQYVQKFNRALGGQDAIAAAAPQGATTGQMSPELVQALLSAAQNPHLGPGQQQIVGSLLNRALTPPPAPEEFTLSPGEVRFQGGRQIAAVPDAPPNPTSAIQNYQFAQSQGFPGTFEEFQTAQRRAGATNVTVGGGRFGAIPQGYQLFEDPQTGAARLELIPGGPAATEATQAEEQTRNRQRQQAISADIVVQDINRALNLVETANIPVTGILGAGASLVPGTAAADVRNLMDTVRANAGFDKLQQLRANSPTGGALGPVSDTENRLLQAAIGSLEQSQTQEQFTRNLRRVRNIYSQIVHGTPAGGTEEGTQPQVQRGELLQRIPTMSLDQLGNIDLATLNNEQFVAYRQRLEALRGAEAGVPPQQPAPQLPAQTGAQTQQQPAPVMTPERTQQSIEYAREQEALLQRIPTMSSQELVEMQQRFQRGELSPPVQRALLEHLRNIRADQDRLNQDIRTGVTR